MAGWVQGLIQADYHIRPGDAWLIMPMTIASLGNSSAATIPTLLDLIHKNKPGQQSILPGDKVVFASVGAGMNINAFLYQF